jgi:heme-degrading monooxygenase HmoA
MQASDRTNSLPASPGNINDKENTTVLQLKPLDEAVPIFQQIGTELSPVVLVNVFQVAKEDIPALLKAWEADANWMKAQPGYISTQLHQGIAGSTVFLNYALWESVAHFRAAFTHPEFKQALSHYPSSAVASPHLFTRLTIPNLCVGP